MEDVIKRRDLNGPFDSVEELMGVIRGFDRFILQEIIVLLCNQTTRPEILGIMHSLILGMIKI